MFTYAWKKDGVDNGSTGSTYTPVSGDIGGVITVAVTATNTQGNATATSAGIAATALPVAPVNTVAPTISGSANTGQTLTAATGTWTGTPTPTYTYVWKRAGSAISGATASNYVVQVADEGSTLTVTVTGTNTQGSASATSAATATVTSSPVAPTNTVAPAITGNPWQGSILTASTGTWTANPAPTYAYQWKLSGTNISGATSSTYQLVTGDVGGTITVSVTATNSQGNATQASSATATVITPPPLINAAPAASMLYVSEGDSITAENQPSYAMLYAASDTTDIIYVNPAVSGDPLANLVARASTIDGYITSNPGQANYVFSCFIGTNDIPTTYTAGDENTFLTAYATYLDARRSAGYTKIAAATLIGVAGNQAGKDWVTAVNTGIRAFVGTGHIDAVIDLVADPVIASHGSELYRDGTHPTTLGHRYLERVAAPVLNALASNATDSVPNAFTFTDITGATASTVYTSNTITVAGITVPVAISITGGTYSINGGSYTSSSGTVSNGNTVAVRQTSSASDSTATNTVLTIGGVSDTYTVTTAAAAPAGTSLVQQYSSGSAGVYTNGNLTFNTNAQNHNTARSADAIPSGSHYFEVHPDIIPGVYFGVGIGVATGTGPLYNDGNNNMTMLDNGGVFIGGVQQDAGTGDYSYAAGATIGVKVVHNGTTGTIRFTKDGTNYTNAIAIDAVLASGAVYALLGCCYAGSAVHQGTANFGATSYAYGLPSGFSNIL